MLELIWNGFSVGSLKLVPLYEPVAIGVPSKERPNKANLTIVVTSPSTSLTVTVPAEVPEEALSVTPVKVWLLIVGEALSATTITPSK